MQFFRQKLLGRFFDRRSKYVPMCKMVTYILFYPDLTREPRIGLEAAPSLENAKDLTPKINCLRFMFGVRTLFLKKLF
jgi:hypothetical protein